MLWLWHTVWTIDFLNSIVSWICSHCIRIFFQSVFECSPLFLPGLLRNIWQRDSNNLLCKNRSSTEMSSGSGYLRVSGFTISDAFQMLFSHLGPSFINKLFKPFFPQSVVVNCSYHVILTGCWRLLRTMKNKMGKNKHSNYALKTELRQFWDNRHTHTHTQLECTVPSSHPANACVCMWCKLWIH